MDEFSLAGNVIPNEMRNLLFRWQKAKNESEKQISRLR